VRVLLRDWLAHRRGADDAEVDGAPAVRGDGDRAARFREHPVTTR
jgi:hypothetical protein